jgi:hypothetical protein
MSKHKRDRSRRKGVNMARKSEADKEKEYANCAVRNATKNGGFKPFWGGKKALIVGSMTPPEGIDIGYYYSTTQNGLWKILDDILEINAFVPLIGQLRNNHKDSTIIKKIEDCLGVCGISICDILESVAVKKGFEKKPDDRGLVIMSNGKNKTIYFNLDVGLKEKKIKFALVNGDLANDLCFRKKVWTCKEYTVIRVMSPSANARSSIKPKENWKLALEAAGVCPLGASQKAKITTIV